MPRRTIPVERPSRFGYGSDPTAAPAMTQSPVADRPVAPQAGRARSRRARRLSAAVAAAAASCPSAFAADDGVVELSAGPAFDAAPAAWVEPAGGVQPPGAAQSAGPLQTAGGILPAGYVTPAARFGPHGGLPGGPGPMAGPHGGGPHGAGPARAAARGGLYDPAVRPAGFAPPAAYCPPGMAGFGGTPVDYRVRGNKPGLAGSLWTTIARYRPPEGSFVRFEYLRYGLAGEETGVVGADIPGITTGESSIAFPFGEPVFDERNEGDFTRQAVGPDGPIAIPGLNNNDVDDFEGVRLTFSRPIKNVGRAEFIAFAFAQETFTLTPPRNQSPRADPNLAADPAVPTDGILFPRTAFPTDIGFGVTLNGDPGNPAIGTFFDTDYDLEYETELWGTGGRVYFDHLAPPQGFGLRPTLGARYVMFNQNLYQKGTTLLPSNVFVDREVSTTVHNNLFGPELGVEAELRHEWFTVGVRPTLTVGLNQTKVRTRSVDFVPGEGTVENSRKFTEFAPILDLAAYVRVPLGESLKLSVGYDLLYLGRVARPNDSTLYDAGADENGVITESRIRPRKSFDDATFNGLTIGVEMLLP